MSDIKKIYNTLMSNGVYAGRDPEQLDSVMQANPESKKWVEAKMKELEQPTKEGSATPSQTATTTPKAQSTSTPKVQSTPTPKPQSTTQTTTHKATQSTTATNNVADATKQANANVTEGATQKTETTQVNDANASQNADGGSTERKSLMDLAGVYEDKSNVYKWYGRDYSKWRYLSSNATAQKKKVEEIVYNIPDEKKPNPQDLKDLLNLDWTPGAKALFNEYATQEQKDELAEIQGRVDKKKELVKRTDNLIDSNLEYFGQFFYEGQSPEYIKDFIVDNFVYKNDGEIFKYADQGEEKLAQYLVARATGMKKFLGSNAFNYFMNNELSSDKANKILDVAYYINENFGRVIKANIPDAFLEMLKATMEEVTKPYNDGTTLMEQYENYKDVNGKKVPIGKSNGENLIEQALNTTNDWIFVIQNYPTRQEREDAFGKDWEKKLFKTPWDSEKKQMIKEVETHLQNRTNLYNNESKLDELLDYQKELSDEYNKKLKGDNKAQSIMALGGALKDLNKQNNQLGIGYTPMVDVNKISQYVTGMGERIKYVELAIRMREEVDERIKNAKDKNSSLAMLWNGLKNGVTDPNLWTRGLSGFEEGLIVEKILNKYDETNPNSLTKEEQMVLEAFTTRLSAEAMIDLGIAYDVGRGIPESIGFMVDILTSPTSGAGNALSKKFGKWLLKKYGKNFAKNSPKMYKLGKGVGYFGGSGANALVTSLTTGAPRTLTNVTELTRNQFDENGKLKEGESFGKALLKGTYLSAVDYFTEDFIGKVLGDGVKGLTKVGGKVSNLWNDLTGLKPQRVNKTWEDFKKRVKFHGTPMEFAEEMVAEMLKAPANDSTFDTDEKTGIFNTRKVVTTYLSCMAIGTVMNMPNAVTYKSESSRIKRNVEQSNALGGSVFSREKWNGIKSRIDNASAGEIEGVVMSEMMNGKLNTTQKKAILKYAGARVQQDALLLRENELAMEAKASKVIDAQGTLNDKTKEGYNATDENEQRRMAILAQQSEQEVKAMLGGNEPEAMSALNTRYGVTTAEDLVAKVVNDESLTPEQRNAILNYINTDASKHAIEKRMADDANAQIMQAKREIDSYANEDAVQARNPNNVITAKLKEDDSQVYIIAGKVDVEDPKGSSESIVVFNPNAEDPTKQKVMTTPAQLYDVTKGNAQAMLDERVSQIKAEHQRKLTQVTTGERTFEINQQIAIPTQDGQGVQTATITNITPGKDGSPLITYTSDVDGTTSQVTIPKAEVEQKMDEVLLIGNTPSANEAPSTITAEPQINVPQAPVAEVEETKPIEVEDNVTFEVDGNQLQGVVASIEEGDGVAIVQTEDEKVHRVPLDNLTIVEETATKEQGGNNVESTANATSEGSSQAILDNSNEVEQNAPIAPTESTPQAETPSESTSQDANDSKLPPLMGIPTDENGNKLYEQASVEATINDIYNDPELDEEEADAYVQARIDGATQRIADLEAKKPKMGESKEAYIAERATWREEIATQQASLDYWNGVQAQRAKAKSFETDDVIDEPNVPMMSAEESDEGNKLSQEEAQAKAEAERVAREKAREKAKEAGKRAEERARHRGDYRKAMSQWEDAPGSFFEYVAQALLIGNHKMRWNDVGATRGLGRHTTGRRGRSRRGDVVTQKNEEAKQLSWLIDDREGLSPEALADRLWNEYTGSYGEDMREGSPLDVLLDVVTSMPTPQMMWEYVKGEHDARMEAEQGGYEEQYSEEEIEAFERDAMYREKYGVSEEEYWAQEALWDEFIESRDMSAEELENYDNFVAEQRIKEEYERRNQENAEDEQRSNNSESERGTDVLSGTQSDNTRGNGDVAGESEGINGSSTQSNDVAQEETRLSEEDRQAIENMPIPMLKRQIKETTTTLINVSQLSSEWQEKNRDKIERAKLILAYAKEELARKERLKKSNKWGIKVGNTATPFDVVRKMFGEFNSNEDIAQLFDKVAKVFESLPIKIVFSDTIGSKGTQGWFSPTTATLKLPGHFVYGGRSLEQSKAETILHEMIHAVTTYALYINEKPHLQTNLGFRLSDDMHAAIRQLKRIYTWIASDKDFKGEYGATSVHEMVAELSNVQFREKLKKKGLWQTIVDAIKQLFGIEPSNALEGAEAALEYMLNNFDRSQWEKMAGMGRKRSNQMRNEDNNQEKKLSTKKKNPRLEESKADTEEDAVKTLEEVYRKGDEANKERAKTAVLNALQDNISMESVDATLSNIRGRKRRIGWRQRRHNAEARAEYRALKFLEKAYEGRSRELHAMDRFGKALGVTVQVVDQVDGGKANAKIVGNKVLIAKDAQQGIKEALAHELLHRIKALSPEAYEAFAQAIEKVFANPIELADGRKTLTFEQMMVNMRMRYSSHRMDISIEGVREEVVADLAGMIMTDAELMERFVEETEGKEWYWQIWDTIKELLEVAKNVFRGQDHRNFANAEKVLLEAMQMASEVQSNENEERKEEKEKYSLIGERGAIALDKAEEATHRMENLDMARKMERFDYPTKAIRMATGWERGADGKWRYEIDDDFVFDINGNVDYGKRNPQRLNDYKRYKELLHKKNALAFEGKQLDAEEQVEFDDLAVIWKGTKLHNSTRLKDYIDYPELFEAYPELRDVSISFDNINARGEYDSSANEITLSNTLSPNEAKSTLIHEIQHAIQKIEGFARGGNVEASKNLIRERNNKALIWSFQKNISHMAKDNPGLSPLELIDKVLARRVELTGDNIATLEEQGAIPNEDGRIKAYNLWARGYDNEGYENAYNMVLGDDAYEVYRRHAGEVEARNVQSRIGMTPEQRRATLLAETEDVARKDQIFLRDNSGVSAMASPFEYFTGTLVDLISIAKNAVKGLFKKIVTPVSSRLVGDLKELGIDISEEYKHVVDNYAIRHTFNNHGGKGESLRGQIPIKNSDFELIPDIVNNYDNITTIVTKKGLPGILYEKTFEDGTTVYVEEIHNKHKELMLVSMRKIKRPTLLGANRTNEPTPIPSSGKSSADKGSDNIGDVQGLEDYSAEEIKEIAREYIEDVIAENGFDADVVDLAIYGSRRRGDARDDSDLDIVVEYSGNVSEDGLFNALNNAETQLEINGVKVDINPITKGKSGSLSEFMKRAEEYDNDTKYSIRSNTPFYSNAEYAVENIKQGKATPEQWLAMIQKNGGLKAGEDKWLGLSDWLKASDAKTLTKEEVLEFINQNKIVIEEVSYEDYQSGVPSGFGYELRNEMHEYAQDIADNARQEYEDMGYDEEDVLEETRRAVEENLRAKYNDDAVYFISLGNDFEIIDTGNDRDFSDFADAIWHEKHGNVSSRIKPANSTRIAYTTNGLENKREIALVVPTIDPYNASDEIHFGDAGSGRAVAWVRFGETTDENGNRVLVIDEIQSKRHQDGREKGYRDAEIDKRAEEARKAYIEADKAFNQFRKQLMEKYNYSSLVQGTAEERREGRKIWRSKFTPEEMTKYDQLHNKVIDTLAAHDNLPRQINRVPDAPFEKNWHELAMKRMLRYAAENGFDKVAWTTGAQQAERYDMGSVVKAIRKGRENDIIVIDLKNGEYIPLVVDKNGLVISGKYQGEKLSNIIGKELAEKAMDLPIGERLADVDLHIGGEGMKGFYDKMLPSFMNKYSKKWGVKVGEVTMPELQEGYQTMHSIDVTDAMKESVMEGQPMFSLRSDADLSYANDPFAKALGKSQRTKAQQAKFAERERKAMRNKIDELVNKLHLENVEVIEKFEATDQSSATAKRKARAKGWFDSKTGKIVINLGNHLSVADVERTLLHEAVAHYGLRELFGEQFDTFLDNVYNNAEDEIKTQIDAIAKGREVDTRTATEEYLASLAEDTQFEYLENQTSFWMKIKQLFMDMLESIGWNYQGPELSDNELRYILWRSYENMVNPGRHRSILGMAEDVVKREKFGIGTHSTASSPMSQVAEGEEAKYLLRGDSESIGEVNERFNAELQQQVDGTLPKGHIYQLGMPCEILLATGFPNMPIEMSSTNLAEHAKKTHHPFDIGEVKNLVYALQNPIAVFAYGDKEKSQNVIVEIQKNGRNFLIGVHFNQTRKGTEVSSVRGIFPKDNAEWLNWITQGKTLYLNKERVQDLINQQRKTLADVEYLDLNSVANVINEFENPTIDDVKYSLRSDDGLSNPDKVIAREAYERMVASGRYQFTEAMQDSMMGLKLLYKAILGKKMQVENIPDFENAYIAENLMSSQNAAMQQEYYIKFMKPLVKAIHSLGGKDKAKRQAIIDYMMAKHGLERNQVMAQRDAKAVADEAVKDITEEDKKNDKWQQVYNEALAENREKDYAGLTALTEKETVAEAEAKAQEMVDTFEANHDVTELWNRINDATKANLERLRKGGVISTQQYRDTLEMYEYYIPLRGWDATTSDEVYAYLTSKNTGMQGSTMKGAKGRKSKADDPIATIGAMADSAIREANRNAMKQRFLNFVLNHPSDLVSVDSIWLQYDDVTNTWIPVFANIKAEDTPDVIEQKLQEFNEKMQQLRNENPGKYKHDREAQNIPYVVKPGMDKEHQVMVKRNGQTYILTINGNPRAAQALNGLTNPDVDVEGVIGKLLKSAEWVNRQLSAFYTTRNPDFVVSNFARDMIYSNVMAIVKEPIGYSMRFHANCGVAFSMLPKLIYKWEHGTLDMNNNLENMFYQFMINGGETGYTEIRDVEKHKRMIASELKKHKNVAKNAWHGLGAMYDGWNRSIENIARFAAFKTSREMGRTVQRSAYDAKEISVNFNKKGSGAKMLDAIGQTALGNFGAWLSGSGRLLWVFWNAGVQGATNFGKNVKRHPGMSLSMMTLMYALGVLLPMANDGDDEEKYYLLPEYVRRSNICFRVDDVWVTIPLPIEFRAMYGLGELYTAVTSGNEKLSDEELALAIAGQVSQTLPLDMLEGGGGLNAVIPSSVKPFIEAYRNVSWSGSPIHRDFYTIEEGKYNPQWTLAYPSTSSFLMNLTKTLNEWGGGDNNLPTKGEWWADWNPAKIEYILKGMFGGLYSTANKLYKTVETIRGKRKFESKNIPLWNRVVKDDDPEAKTRKINNAYYDAIDWSAEFEDKYKKTKKLSKGSVEYASKLDELMKSDEYKKFVYVNGYKEAISLIRKRLNYEGVEISAEELNERILALKKEMVEGMDTFNKKTTKEIEKENVGRELGIDESFKDVDKRKQAISDSIKIEEKKASGASGKELKEAQNRAKGRQKAIDTKLEKRRKEYTEGKKKDD